ncbi:DNA primase [BD1-7 clade bacterium]|uniref:DNA primase n=1 Tax=BD1-7 clade bacterium TaxID=2029982 RepID=A0A5S9QQM1_9GAMM|nr:DNA primase [BD1-7 clade bacterium]CAA0121433.1 DNA primase [BD1-7 clade bacterium]
MAGRIPQSFIDNLLERTDLVELIDGRVKLKKTGRNYSACCPFHDEKTPSFSVNPDKQFYYCFGCGAGGNALSFVMEYDRLDFIEAIEQLAKAQNIDIPRDAPTDEQQTYTKSKNSIYDLLEQANQWYQQQLMHHGEKLKVVEYLKDRGLNGEICKEFEVGFAPPGWRNLKTALATDDTRLEHLIEGGMLIEKEGSDKAADSYDRFRDRLIFPIRDNRGRTIGFGGRVFGDEKPKYLNSPETPVFHKNHELYGLYQARQSNRHLQRLIMVEGYMDVIGLAQHGIRCAVATLGTAAGTTHMEKVFRHTSEVVFCFDGDDAGKKAADRALDAVLPFMQAGRQARFLFLPDGEDPDTMVRKHGNTHFEHLIERCETLSEYLFSKASRNLDMGRADDRAQLINQLMPAIKSMPPGTYRELVLRSISEKTGLPIDDLKDLEAIDRPTAPPKHTPDQYSDKHTNKPAYTAPKSRSRLPVSKRRVTRNPVRVASSLLLLNPQLIQALPGDFSFAESDVNHADLELLLTMISQLRANTDTSSSTLIGQSLAKNADLTSQLLALEHHGDEDEHLIQEFTEAIECINDQYQREKSAAIIENTKLNPKLTLNDMSAEERANWLKIFDRSV